MPQARTNLQLALRFLGQAADAPQRFQEVTALAADAPAILRELAWFFATQPNTALRNGAEAVRLAERASILTKRTEPLVEITLAAAYGEAGRMPEAIPVAEAARLRARSIGDAASAALAEKLLATLQSGRAYRDEGGTR
jgi:hypothetical protein